MNLLAAKSPQRLARRLLRPSARAADVPGQGRTPRADRADQRRAQRRSWLHQSGNVPHGGGHARHHRRGNGDYVPSLGWDACTGLDSPDGADIAAVLEAAVAH
jgi:hypothetical protein